MLFLKILSILASTIVIYPFRKLYRKDEINVFDLIILFYTIFYCLIPLFSEYSAFQWLKGFFFENDIIFYVFIYYIISIVLILATDLFWTKHYKYKISILNITYYLKNLPPIKVTWFFLIIIFFNMIISWVWYLPQASYMDSFNEYYQTQGYVKSPMYLLYGAILMFCFSFSQIIYFKENLKKKKKIALLITLLGFGFLLLFMPRRIMLFYLILSLIIIYSVKRDFFTFKKMLCIGVVLLVILKVYFPFYNVMRRTDVKIDRNNFATSIIQIVEEANELFDTKKEHAAETSEGRALNLYYALYRIIKYDKSPSNGGLFIAAVDHALPKLINPNKGEGTEKILEKKMLCNKDQADSILLLAYGDFGLFVGAFYSFLLIIIVISIHVLFDKLNRIFFFNESVVDILLIVYLISFAWNVEQKLDMTLASFVHLAIMTIVLMFSSRYNIIRYKNNLFN